MRASAPQGGAAKQPRPRTPRMVRKASGAAPKFIGPLPQRSSMKGNAMPENVNWQTISNMKTPSQELVIAEHPAAYVTCLTCPAKATCRVPDSFGEPSSLWTSTVIIEPTVNFSGTPDDGKFAAAFQVNVGQEDFVTSYQNLVVNSTGGWPVDLTAAASFLRYGDGGSYLPQDQYVDELFSPTIGYFDASGNASSVAGASVFGTVLTQAAVPPSTYNVIMTTAGLVNTFTGFEAGQYSINIFALYTAATEAAGAFTVAPVGNAIIVNPIGQTVNDPATGNVLAVWDQFTVTVYSSTDGFTVTNDGAFGPLNGEIIIVPSIDQSSKIPLLGGFVSKFRPVAMSVLCTNQYADAYSGGTISCSLLPGTYVNSNFCDNAPTMGTISNVQGNFTDSSTLGRQDPNVTYNGKEKDGCYCWWRPYDTSDTLFYTPSDQNEHIYPVIFLAGTLIPATAQAAGTNLKACRITVTRVYEFITASPLFHPSKYIGDEHMLAEALLWASQQPASMANFQHVKFVKDVGAFLKNLISKGATFYNSNKSWINPLALAAASAF